MFRVLIHGPSLFFSPPITETARGRASSIAQDGRDQEAVRALPVLLLSCFVSRVPLRIPHSLGYLGALVTRVFSLISAYAFRAFSRHTTAHLSHMRPPASTPCPVFIWVGLALTRETPGVVIHPRIRSLPYLLRAACFG